MRSLLNDSWRRSLSPRWRSTRNCVHHPVVHSAAGAAPRRRDAAAVSRAQMSSFTAGAMWRSYAAASFARTSLCSLSLPLATAAIVASPPSLSPLVVVCGAIPLARSSMRSAGLRDSGEAKPREAK
uniref:Uncharacterized protein n=1 Tax=Arundo donax TaxID=35708 RepID=A0A0A9D983_ARUDO